MGSRCWISMENRQKSIILKNSFNISWAPDAGNPWKIDNMQYYQKHFFNISWAPDAGTPIENLIKSIFSQNSFTTSWAPDAGNPWKIDRFDKKTRLIFHGFPMLEIHGKSTKINMF